MRRRALGVAAAGLAVAVAAESVTYLPEEPGLVAADATVGFAFIGLGVVAWRRRPSSRSGLLMAATGVAWFAGSFADAALFLHRGPLVHLLVGYPRGRLRSRLEQVVVAAAYVDAAVYPLARQDIATIVLSLAVVATALVGYLRSSGPERRARAAALVATSAVALALGFGAVGRLADVGTDATGLWAYQGVLVLVAVGLFADLLWGRWTQAAITGLVVDLGEPDEAGTLRAKLARAVGDPSLVVAYRLPDADGYVDEAGRPVALPAAGANRVVTYLQESGQQIGALVHDAAVLDDPDLVSAVAAAAGVAVANARLQAEVRARVREVEASRRRIVEAGDTERRRLERELHEGAQRRLAHVTELLADRGPPVAGLQRELETARAALTEFARGVHPKTLTEAGLAVALAELSERCPVPVQVGVPEERLAPTVEAAVYFICSEALTNVAKYAQASQATIRVGNRTGLLVVEVEDDGVGGADPARGSGLRGLADRVEALQGRLRIESPRGRGTHLVAEIPLSQPDATA
ncbi:MAG TPA: ATP-binding protein [Actinomycetes bacterium]|jgi:signal transduction histidine kinase|nr:ATP-binding protein [Actinomycetes bacterium]